MPEGYCSLACREITDFLALGGIWRETPCAQVLCGMRDHDLAGGGCPALCTAFIAIPALVLHYALCPIACAVALTKPCCGGSSSSSSSAPLLQTQPQPQPQSTYVPPIIAQPPPAPRPVPTIPFDEITLGSKIGEGAFGIVYRGRWQDIDVAIKSFKSQFDSQARAELGREAEAMSRLSHGNVVIFYGAITDKSPGYIVMELAQQSLRQALDRATNPLPEATQVSYATQMAQGLEYLHQQRVLHRDLKASNVLVTKDGSLKLTDFGIAKIVAESASRTAYMGQATGTVTHMAPELFRRQAEFSAKSDVWAYAMTLWETAMRKLPYKDAQNAQIVIAWIQKPDEREKVPASAPQVIRQVMEQCWVSEPANRPDVSGILRILMGNSFSQATAASFAGNYATEAGAAAASAASFAGNDATNC